MYITKWFLWQAWKIVGLQTYSNNVKRTLRNIFEDIGKNPPKHTPKVFQRYSQDTV